MDENCFLCREHLFVLSLKEEQERMLLGCILGFSNWQDKIFFKEKGDKEVQDFSTYPN